MRQKIVPDNICRFVCLLLLCFSLVLVTSERTMAFFGNFFRFNSPSFTAQSHEGLLYRFCKPNVTPSSSGKEVKYPLVVYLHGAGERGTDNRIQSLGLAFLGNGFGNQAESYQDTSPSFVFVPQCPPGKTWEGDILDKIIQTVEYLKSAYPVDPGRLYLIGYSMGGSGTYALAHRYEQYNGQLFAGIIRVAGQSSFAGSVHETIGKSSVWLHIGLQDTQLRIDRVREAYNILKNLHGNGREYTSRMNFGGRQALIRTYVVNNKEKFKLTEYPEMGHGINLLPFDNPEVLEWLFALNIK